MNRWLLLAGLMLSGCVSTIGKSGPIRCQIYQSRSYWLTGAGIGFAAATTGLGTAELAVKTDKYDAALTATVIGTSAAAAALAWFGNTAAGQAVQECKAK